jgi:hypothetical protein
LEWCYPADSFELVGQSANLPNPTFNTQTFLHNSGDKLLMDVKTAAKTTSPTHGCKTLPNSLWVRARHVSKLRIIHTQNKLRFALSLPLLKCLQLLRISLSVIQLLITQNEIPKAKLDQNSLHTDSPFRVV